MLLISYELNKTKIENLESKLSDEFYFNNVMEESLMTVSGRFEISFKGEDICQLDYVWVLLLAADFTASCKHIADSNIVFYDISSFDEPLAIRVKNKGNNVILTLMDGEGHRVNSVEKDVSVPFNEYQYAIISANESLMKDISKYRNYWKHPITKQLVKNLKVVI